MSFRLLQFVIPVIALVCGTSVSQAQFMQMATPKFPLLMNRMVQQELKLTDEQNKKIQAKVKELMPEGSPFVNRIETKGGDKAASSDDSAPKVNFGVVIQGKGQGGAASPPVVLGNGANFKVGEGGSFTMPDFKKIDAEVEKLLEQPQRDRLKQLALQRTGMVALAQEQVARDVGLEDDQKDLVKHILEDQQKKMQEYFRTMIEAGTGFNQEKIGEFTKKQREQTESDLAIILTPDQKAKWDELLGAKFDFKGKQ
ncbi:MAG TPA: hypothetical protein PLN21_20330 [Gemmatales bacterium]|nr:hypothetical protein [Gemmatales bacterium]